MKTVVAAVLLAGACALVSLGAAMLAPAAGFIVGGVLLAAWTVVVVIGAD